MQNLSPPFQSNPISNILRTITGLYVYCNIINYQFVGNTYAPLLRTITINENTDNYGKYIEQVYTAPHYISLSVYNIESIEVDIRDDTGEKIQFEAGKVLVKLVECQFFMGHGFREACVLVACLKVFFDGLLQL